MNTPNEAFFYIDIFFVKQVWITYQSIILHMKRVFIVQLPAPSCRAGLCESACTCLCLKGATGGLCSLVHSFGFASIRFLGDSSHTFTCRPVEIVVGAFHPLFSGHKGSGLVYMRDVSTWRRVGLRPEVHVVTHIFVWETYFSCIQPKHEVSTSQIRSGLFEWFASNPRDLCTLIYIICLFTEVDESMCRLAFAAKTKHNRWFFVLHTDSWIMFYT